MTFCFGTDQSPKAFESWAKKRGIFLHADVAFLVPTKTMGSGVFARRSLPKGTVIVSCPFSSSISPYAEPSCVDAPCVEALNQAHITDNVLYVVLRLMAEAVRGSSPWLPWLRACPRMLNHFFDNELLGNIFNATACEAVGTVSTRWTGVSQQVLEMRVSERWKIARRVIEQHPEHWPESSASFSFFCECLSFVLSRNFHREDVGNREGPYLLPGLDMVNHSFEANAKLEVRGGGRKHVLSFCLVASSDLRKGEQVLFSYGRIGGARFVVEFQFITEPVVKEDMLRFSVDVLVEIVAAIIVLSGQRDSVEAVEGALRWRVERLQRLGFLFDEGLYVPALPQSSSDTTGDATLPLSATKEVNRLFNVIYLLSVEEKTFDDLTHKINREWEVQRTDSLLTMVSTVIAMRAGAARDQLAIAQERLSGCEHNVRRKLLEMVLGSELRMLDALNEYVKRLT
uniref:Uncharacterized protein TCIL3000_10_8670 n=1 Tax=Trypanosoma congolense (strain IL3000) TaxID=1068625 RepID=G0UXH4_TRYCI|nr:unnamed protein product [Trypanosoma congolense IL3000]